MMRLVLVLMLWATPAFAQNHYPLEIISPLAIGAAGTGFDSDHRIYRAYQGITYVIKADAVGGRWPYTFSLSGEPDGMTIVQGPCTTVGSTCTAGTITWTNPQSTDASITVQICDADSDCVSATWGVTVSTTIGANGFCFINSSTGNDTTGNGSLATPWQTLNKGVTTCGANSILYLRGGTYTTANMTLDSDNECGRGVTNGSTWVRDTDNAPVIWIGYPGETAIIDEEYPTKSVCIEFVGSTIWLSNLRVINCGNECFQFHRSSRFGVTAIYNEADTFGPGVDGDNPGVFMWAQLYGSGDPNTQAYFDLVTNNVFTNGITSLACTMRAYSMLKPLIAYNDFTTIASLEVIAVKSDISQYTVRANVCTGITGTCLTGGMSNVADQSYGEFLFNNVKDSSAYGIEVNQGADSGVVYLYRNTVQGNVRVRNTGTGDGPFNFTDNVFINAGGSGGSCPARLTCDSVTDYSVIVLSGNRQGSTADGIVDADGVLQEPFRSTDIGNKGWEVVATPAAGKRFAPLNLQRTEVELGGLIVGRAVGREFH